MRQDRRCTERAATLKRIWVSSQRIEEEAALALAGCAARTPQRDASVDMWCNPGRPQPSIGVKRKIYTENPHYHMNECQQECMAHSERFLLKVGVGGGRNSVLTTKCCLYGGEETSWCVFCTRQKRSRDEAKGIQEIKEKPMGKWIKCFVLQEKRNQSFRRFGHEYNYNWVYCQAHVAHGHTSTSRKWALFFLSLHFFQHLTDKPISLLPVHLSLSVYLFIFSHNVHPGIMGSGHLFTFGSGVWVIRGMNTSPSCRQGTGSQAVLALLWKFYSALPCIVFIGC